MPLGIVAIALILWQLRGEWAEARGERFDLVGSALYAVALVLVMYGVSLLPEQSAVGLLLAGAVGLALFGWWEVTAPRSRF